MKNIIFLIVVTLLSLGNSVISQSISEEKKQRIFSDLDSSDFIFRWGALEEIIFYDIEDAVPKLEDIIWLQEPDLQTTILQILNVYNSSKTYEYTLAFMDSVDNYSYENLTIEPLDLKIEVMHILFKFNDYSGVNYVFEIINRDRPKINPYARELLDDIIKNVPEYADSAKAELLKLVMNNDSDPKDRYAALARMNELYGDEILDEIRETFINNSDEASRIMAMKFLFQHEYPQLNTLLKERLPLEPDPAIRYSVAEALLDSFGTISDYEFLQNYQKNEVDTTITFLIKSDLYVYKPLHPAKETQIITMLDTLISYTNQCYGYDWLRDEAYKNELLDKIETAKNYISSADSVNCAIEMKKFQNSVAKVYADSAGSYPRYVNNDGYKFLYYYAGYILDRLPEPAEGLPVKMQGGRMIQNNKKRIK